MKMVSPNGLVTKSMLFGLLIMPLLVQAASDDIEREFDVAPGGLFMLESDAGAIDINTWDQPRVRVRVRNANGFEVSFDQNADNVSVVAESERSFFGFGRSNIHFNVDVPRTFNLELETGGGSITVADISGRINADTSGGPIDIGDVTQGDVYVDTSGGRITVGNVEGNVEADTSGGSITIGNVSGNVNADTSGGRITIGNVQGDILADTSGGNIEVGESGGRVQLDTSGGSIRAEWAQGAISADTSGGNIYLAGSSTRVEADTSGGNIDIAGSDGPVIADTSGGSITVRGAGPVRADTSGGRIIVDLSNVSGNLGGEVELESAGGDITLRIPENLAVTVHAVLKVSRRSRGDYGIYTDFPLVIQDEGDEIIGRGEINGGGDRVSIRSENSDINIVRIEN